MRSTTAYSCTCGARARKCPRTPTAVRCRRRRRLHPQTGVCQLWRTHACLTELSQCLSISDSAGQTLRRRHGHRPPVSQPGWVSRRTEIAEGSAGLRRSLVTRGQCQCRAGRRNHDAGGAMSTTGSVTRDIEGTTVSATPRDDIDDRRWTEEAGPGRRSSCHSRAGSVRPRCQRGHCVSDLSIDIFGGAPLMPGCADIGATDSARWRTRTRPRRSRRFRPDVMTRVAKPLNDNASARTTDVIHPDREPGSSRANADDMAPTTAGGPRQRRRRRLSSYPGRR
jgi:hypothetical protein